MSTSEYLYCLIYSRTSISRGDYVRLSQTPCVVLYYYLGTLGFSPACMYFDRQIDILGAICPYYSPGVFM